MDRNRESGCGKSSPSWRQLRNILPIHRSIWKQISLAALGAFFLILIGGCGGSSASTTDPVTIAISPSTVTLPVSTSQQFSAPISNSTNTTITWQVNGATGGSATFGTISTSGLYTAPSSVPSTAITVTAISQADTTKTATASVTVTNATKIVVSPAQMTIAAGGQQTFSATLGNAAVDAAWSVSCQNATAGSCGTVSSTGVYTAPLAPPPGQSITIFASSKSNNAVAGNGTITVTFGSGTLFGQYSFAMRGLQAGQPFSAVGSISFDGTGGITGGIEDIHGKATPITISGGTYVSGVDGRVTATVHTSSGDEGWQISLVNHSRALITRADSVIANGQLDAQNNQQFGHGLSGNFTLHLAGKTASSTIPVTAMLGGLIVDTGGNVTSGTVDVNDSGSTSAKLSVTGTSTTSSSDRGRGTLSLLSSFGSQTFAYYVLDSATAKLIEIDGAHDLSGTLEFRPSTVAAGNFSGLYAFVFSGANSQGAVGQGGTFVTDANGVVTNGTFDVSTDSAFSLGFLFSGSFVVSDAAIGRTIATFNVGGSTLQYVVYPPGLNNQLEFLEIDSQNATSGVAMRQSSTISGTTIPSVTGQFALAAGETSAAVKQTISGIIIPAAITTGTLDVNANGNITLGTNIQNSRFTVSSLSGRGSLQLQAGGYQAGYTTYVVDDNNLLMLQTDGKGALSGLMQRQY
jgi:hypothetical protein